MPSVLKDKHIIVGITGSIAAYKAAILIRLLVKAGAEVKVIMTPMAKQFITPLTLATLAKNPILVDFYNPENGDWNSHVDLGMWADLYLIAPASANTIGKMANGIADNLLLTTYLSAKCPVCVAPAMDLDMYAHPANLKNLETLKSYGNKIIEPAAGELASGLVGKGRMEEPEAIVKYLEDFFFQPQELSGKHFLVTAGPTYEAIDPVRFIGNWSSGKMGYALAEELAARGANVTLVSGPTNLSTIHPNINRVNVISAEQMHQKCIEAFPHTNGAIMCAAVADYRPESYSDVKIKRKSDDLTINLTPNKDIAAELGKMKTGNQVLVGFALETNEEEQNSFKKLKSKNLDFIVLNSLRDKGAGFHHDTNKISIIFKDGEIEHFDLKSKVEVAQDIVNQVVRFL
ncbi:bifunctional phosphopantothenoylcysteine decarboxylase/phosphopantothenate--cysteine ligase CoaBC [Acetobacteroides hydrogenigenes]|uniref:Coenzyme A biosynthesis bifunctional protein CoaBC n=1 Tax=Acetobacteroides hydrogenigenes TaxID=979970 RepID=A0A4R2EU62_9BACT|nr:bifunctional phosphopantothenoylcysteine decarboxylase/phosphopantothenate--cysteine ligase CoaBC [Acetobacteroides hydrogenigenes]TCN72829.1 phosphopantothenoylcysteine decarboxylase/phosphopantothenate--cysteine ligase [Acetobacteroides hydrogenigenes]